jgi:hypothetical protein
MRNVLPLDEFREILPSVSEDAATNTQGSGLLLTGKDAGIPQRLGVVALPCEKLGEGRWGWVAFVGSPSEKCFVYRG